MDVLFITEGGRDKGCGHLIRCLSLCQAFEERGIQPEFVISGDDSVRKILEDRKLRLFNWVKNFHQLARMANDVDIIILDSYEADHAMYKKLADQAKCAVYFDDNLRMNYPQGIVVNGSIYATELNYPENNKVIYLLGPDYVLLRKAFWKIPEKNIKEEIKSVLVTFGGDDSKNMTPEVLRSLAQHFPHWEKSVIVGPSMKTTQEIEYAADKHTKLYKSFDDTQMRDLMLVSDVAVSSGGQTLLELARIGIPTVAIAVADNQRNNVRSWEDKGFIESAGSWSDHDVFSSVVHRLKRFTSYKRRRQSSETGRRLIARNGAEKIIDTIEERLKKH